MPRNSDSDPYPEPVGSESGMANLLVTTVMYGLRLQSPEINATMLHQLAKAVKITPPTRLKSCTCHSCESSYRLTKNWMKRKTKTSKC